MGAVGTDLGEGELILFVVPTLTSSVAPCSCRVETTKLSLLIHAFFGVIRTEEVVIFYALDATVFSYITTH